MPLVAFASGTVYFGARDEKREVRPSLYHPRVERLPKARPAGAAIELMHGRKQWEIASRTVVSAGLMILMQRIGERSFRIFVS